MTRSKGRLVALAAVVVGIATVGLAGFLFRDRIVEEYYIWRVKSKDPTAVAVAAKKLGEMRSVRAVAALVEVWIEAATLADKGWTSYAGLASGAELAGQSTRHPGIDSIYGAICKIGRPALPAIFKAFGKGDPWKRQAYILMWLICQAEDQYTSVTDFLLKVKKESIPGSPPYQASTELLPKLRAYEGELLQTIRP